jgi:hypothetical protein
MGYVKAGIAETINLLTGKRGPLWSRSNPTYVELQSCSFSVNPGEVAVRSRTHAHKVF